jgi:hypothetical protein
MATPLLVGNIVKVQGICTKGVQTSLNTAYFEVASVSGGSFTDAMLAHAFDALLGPQYKLMINTLATYYGTLVQKVAPAPVAAYVLDQTNTGPGTASGAALPDEVCGLIGTKTALAGRAFRGRMYTPFLAASQINAGAIDVLGPYVALMGGLAGYYYNSVTFTSGGVAINLYPGVFHKKANKAGTTTPGTVTGITAFVLELALATQRRRSARGRPNNPPT